MYKNYMYLQQMNTKNGDRSFIFLNYIVASYGIVAKSEHCAAQDFPIENPFFSLPVFATGSTFSLWNFLAYSMLLSSALSFPLSLLFHHINFRRHNNNLSVFGFFSFPFFSLRSFSAGRLSTLSQYFRLGFRAAVLIYFSIFIMSHVE